MTGPARSSTVRLGRSFLAAISLLQLACPLSLHPQAVAANEDDIRAAMVSHLPLFVEWPPSKTDPAHPQFRVCLLGSDPIEPTLEAAFHATKTSSVPIVISHVQASDKLDQCHLLYVGASARGSLARLLPQLVAASVLTVSEQSIDSATSEVIGLPLEDNHIRVEVNLAVAQRCKLTISSRLLRLASNVK